MRQLGRLASDWQTSVKWCVGAACVATALALAATGSAAVNALIAGKIMNCGPPGPCVLQHRAVVSAFNAQHRLVAREAITNGHFSFLLASGHYTLSAEKPDKTSASRPVTARPHQTTETKIVFHVPDFTQ